MKKIIILICIFIGIYFSASAQTGKGFEFGIQTGVNISTITDGQNEPINAKLGLNGGVIGEYYFSDRWSIKTKVTYDPKGWNNGATLLDANGAPANVPNFRFNYITIPLLANWHFGPARDWYINFGPYAGFLTGARETLNGTDISGILNNTDIGLSAGLGFKFPIADKIKMFLEYDEQSGLASVYKNTGADRNSRSAFNVGLMFR